MKGKTKGRILIVDDERSMREMLEIFLGREGYDTASCGSVSEALDAMEGTPAFDLVITDINMPGLTGLDLLRKISEDSPGLPVVVITAYGSSDSAVQAMKLGAADYITKPFRIEEIKARICAAVERRKLAEENIQLQRLLKDQFSFENVVGKSEGMRKVFEIIRRVGPMDSTVVISGESGTGKELIARALHFHGGGRRGPFVSVNCGAIVETLLESELFGHKKGSFTGADSDRRGLFETAQEGTLFLDEISETSPALQVKLLRALQEREVVPVGASSPVKVNLRIIAATNRDLAQDVKSGRFREDLYYRLNVIHIKIPPLRERREDIPYLVEHFLVKLGERQGRTLQKVSAEAMRSLMNYNFPGNVRELENVVERAVALAEGEILEAGLLPEAVLRSHVSPPAPDRSLQGDETLDILVDAYEKSLIEEALRRSGGNRTRAAKILGVTFRSFRYRLKKYGMAEDEP